MKKSDKSGQFYLLAATVIIVLIIGFIVVSNYSKKKNSSGVYNLGEELKIEIEKVMNYEVINDEVKIEEFTKNFSDYAGKDIEIVFIIGNTTNLYVYKYNETGQEDVSYINISNTIYVELEGTNHTFELKKGQNFYFIMYQNIEGERYVVTN